MDIDASRLIPHLRSVANGLRLLNILARAHGPIGVTELAQRLDVAPSTAYRLLRTLVAQGFAVQTPSSRGYRRGPLLAGLAAQSLDEHLRLREAARPLLERVASITRETAHLAILDGLEVVGVDHVEGSHAVVARHPVGDHLPAHATAVGQAMLAHLPDSAEAVIIAGLEQLTTETITEPAAFRHLLADVRERGYAVNVRQWNPETAGVAAAVLDDQDEAIASLGISGLASRVAEEQLLVKLGEHARVAADDIADRLKVYASRVSHATSHHGAPN